MAPVSIVADEVMGEMTPTNVDGIFLQREIRKEQKARKQKKEKTEEQDQKEDGR